MGVTAKEEELLPALKLLTAAGPQALSRHARLNDRAERVLARAYAVGALSARGRHRVVRVARTIADIESCPEIDERHVLAALSLRQRSASEEAMAA